MIDASGGKDQRETPPEKASEISRLTAEKLRLEIRELSAPWWRRHLPSIASILAGLLGLFWAISTGFFDVAQRELEIRRQTLLIETDRLEKEKTQQEAAVRLLRRTANDLQRRVEQMDQPFLTGGSFSENLPDQINLIVEGANLGRQPGVVKVASNLECRWITTPPPNGIDYSLSKEGETLRIVSWSERKISLVRTQLRIRDHLQATLKRALVGRVEDAYRRACELESRIIIVRRDGKESNPFVVQWGDVAAWALGDWKHSYEDTSPGRRGKR